MNNNIILV